MSCREGQSPYLTVTCLLAFIAVALLCVGLFFAEVYAGLFVTANQSWGVVGIFGGLAFAACTIVWMALSNIVG